MALASSLPFLLHLVLSGLIWRRRSEVRPYGDEAMLIMWHHIWCVWSVCGRWGRPFDQHLTWWFLRFKETWSRWTGGKNTWKHFGVSRGQNNRRKSPFGLLLWFRNPFNYSKLCLSRSVSVVVQCPVDARRQMPTLRWAYFLFPYFL